MVDERGIVSSAYLTRTVFFPAVYMSSDGDQAACSPHFEWRRQVDQLRRSTAPAYLTLNFHTEMEKSVTDER